MQKEFDCWVVNYENNAFSRYTNFNFNSFSQLDNEYYATSEDGLYILDGDDDDGEDIKAKILTGEMDLSGLGTLSYCRNAIVTQKSDGTLTLNIYAGDEDVENYQMFGPSEKKEPTKLVLSKGRQSTYWQFELTNDEQTKFEVDNIKIHKVVRARF
jgi:hypothetical protein